MNIDENTTIKVSLIGTILTSIVSFFTFFNRTASKEYVKEHVEGKTNPVVQKLDLLLKKVELLDERVYDLHKEVVGRTK